MSLSFQNLLENVNITFVLIIKDITLSSTPILLFFVVGKCCQYYYCYDVLFLSCGKSVFESKGGFEGPKNSS